VPEVDPLAAGKEGAQAAALGEALTDAELVGIWWAPSSPSGKRSASPSSSSRTPPGVRRLGRPESTITISSSA
jgi:hypothetical protein